MPRLFLFTPGRTRGFVKPKGSKEERARSTAPGSFLASDRPLARPSNPHAFYMGLRPKPPPHWPRRTRPGKTKKSVSISTHRFLELLTRFELVTRFYPKELSASWGPHAFYMGLRPKPPPHLRRRTRPGKTKKSVSISTHRFLELLTRFELVTSSLPRTRSTD